MKFLVILVPYCALACTGPPERPSDSAGASFTGTPVAARYAHGCPPRLGNPALARAIFDVYGDARGRSTPRWDSTVRAIERAGGRVLHHFHINVVRAELDTSAARALVVGPNPLAELADQVLDSSRKNLQVQVSFSRPVTGSDSAYISRLGALVKGTVPVRPMLIVDSPDSILPAVMRAPGVESVRASLVSCGRAGA